MLLNSNLKIFLMVFVPILILISIVAIVIFEPFKAQGFPPDKSTKNSTVNNFQDQRISESGCNEFCVSEGFLYAVSDTCIEHEELPDEYFETAHDNFLDFFDEFSGAPCSGSKSCYCESGYWEKISDLRNKCQQACVAIDNANQEQERNQWISEYCSLSFELPNSRAAFVPRFGDVIIIGSGEQSYCADGVKCFNVEEGRCYRDNFFWIGPKDCLISMCRALVNEGSSLEEAENIIKNQMNAGSCNLRQGARVQYQKTSAVEILAPTWWQSYFENPDCSEFI